MGLGLGSSSLTWIQSIYPECVSSQFNGGLLKLEVPIEFGDPRSMKVEMEEHGTTKKNDQSLSRSLSLSTLPPLLLQLSLPPGYPIASPPEILSFRATHLWLSKLPWLQTKLLDQWQPGERVLYNWVEYIRTGEFLSDLGMVSQEGGTTIQSVTPFSRSVPKHFNPWQNSPLRATSSRTFIAGT